MLFRCGYVMRRGGFKIKAIGNRYQDNNFITIGTKKLYSFVRDDLKIQYSRKTICEAKKRV